MISLKTILSESTKTEYIIWGIPPGKRDEEILYTKAKSSGEAKKVIDILTQKYGCKSVEFRS